DEVAPAMVGQAGQVVAAQVHRFLGPQRGVVQATEEGHHPLTEFAVLAYRGEQPPGLVAVDHGSRVHALESPRTGPLDGLGWVGGQSTDLDRVLHQVVQHGPFAVGGVGGCATPTPATPTSWPPSDANTPA